MSRPAVRPTDALVVVDVQRDFCPGGALPVPCGEEVVPVLNGWLEAAAKSGIPVFASRDWHPRGHLSFEEAGGRWPEHCVQDSPGADFHPDLALPDRVRYVTKGVRFDKDQNSAFDETGLETELRRLGVRRILVGGLAQDVCVRDTVMDGLRLGFDVFLIANATRPVDTSQGARVLEEMRSAGAEIGTTA